MILTRWQRGQLEMAPSLLVPLHDTTPYHLGVARQVHQGTVIWNSGEAAPTLCRSSSPRHKPPALMRTERRILATLVYRVFATRLLKPLPSQNCRDKMPSQNLLERTEPLLPVRPFDNSVFDVEVSNAKNRQSFLLRELYNLNADALRGFNQLISCQVPIPRLTNKRCQHLLHQRHHHRLRQLQQHSRPTRAQYTGQNCHRKSYRWHVGNKNRRAPQIWKDPGACRQGTARPNR